MKYLYTILLILLLSAASFGQSDQFEVGDLNLNHVANEISDAVLYSNYFVYGEGVFFREFEQHRLVSDINNDGEYLHVSDLIYLIRIIIGDAPPYPPSKTSNETVRISSEHFIYSANREIGFVSMTLEGNQTPTLLVDNKELLYWFNGTDTKLLIYSLANVDPIVGDFVEVQGKLLSIQVGDQNGQKVEIEYVEPPKVYLAQNYPNPFSPTTSIVLFSAIETDVEIGVYNLLGQRVFSWQDRVYAGRTDIEWDAQDLAPGIYFYKILNHPSKIKKMVLMR